jgi:hypothetical protein
MTAIENELEVVVPTTFEVTGTAAMAFPKGVLARIPSSEAFKKPRRFMKLNGLLICADIPLSY